MIFVLGSFMMDLVVDSKRFPEPGETLIGKAFNMFPGGKGANQSIQIKRLGGDVFISGALGLDTYGDIFIDVLKKENLSTDGIIRRSTNGVGLITVDENAQNKIIIVPGANHTYTNKDLETFINKFEEADIFLSQLELPINVVEKFADYAKIMNKKFVLNPAPAQPLSKDLLSKVDFLTPNETELSILTGMNVETEKEIETACEELLELGVKNIIVTLGDKGAFFMNKHDKIKVKSYKVKAIDTVAAGDSFTGGLVYALDNNYSIKDALKLASACGALAVTKKGAIPSLHFKKDIEVFINEYNLGQD